jgi:hypothetical protein
MRQGEKGWHVCLDQSRLGPYAATRFVPKANK